MGFLFGEIAGCFLIVHLITSEKLAAVKKVGESITLNERKKFHPEQWVKLYGIVSNHCDYIITCQVSHLDTVLNHTQRSWWDDYLLEPVDEEEKPISVEEALSRCHHSVS